MLFVSEPSDSRSDDDGKRKSVESLPSHRNVRLSVQPFDDSDDVTTWHHGEASVDAETPLYSSSSVVWKSSSEAVLDVDTHPDRHQQRGSATDSCSSEQTPDTDGRRLSERDMASSQSSDVVLSSDCSLSSEQSPVHPTEHDQPQSTSCSAVAVSAHVDRAVRHDEVVSGSSPSDVSVNANIAAKRCVSESETVPDGNGCSEGSGSLLDEIDSHLKQTHGRQLLPASDSDVSGTAAKRSPDDMSLLDIDTALAEVMSGLELLGRSRGLSLDHGSTGESRHPAATVSSTSSSPLGRIASPHTPDLVMGLPQFAAGAQPATSPRLLEVAGSPPQTTRQLTTAEMFANVDRCTIKKSAPTTSAPSSAEIWTSSVHPLRVVDSPPQSAATVVGGMVSAAEMPNWSPVRSFGDSGSGIKTRGLPARSQSCRAAERQSDQTWSTLWMTSTEIQRDREFVRTVVPQFTAARQPSPLSPPAPGRDRGVSFDGTELPRFPSSASAVTGSRKDPSTLTHSFIATLPRDGPHGGPKTPVKVKPPVMKKPVRSAEMMRRLSEYQSTHQQVTDSASLALPK